MWGCMEWEERQRTWQSGDDVWQSGDDVLRTTRDQGIMSGLRGLRGKHMNLPEDHSKWWEM